MLQLKDAIDEKTLVIIQRMFMQFLHSSTALYEADGSYVYRTFEGQYCNFLNIVSCQNADSCEKDASCSGKWICHEDCWNISRESISKCEPVEKECSGGIFIYAVPIIFNGQAIGSINAGITNPPLEKSKIKSVAKVYSVDDNVLLQRANAFKRLTNEEMEIARGQLRMAALLVSSLYESRLKQVEAENEVNRQKEQLEAIIENMDDAVFILDAERKYYLVNKTARDFYSDINLDKLGDSCYKYKYYDINVNEVSIDDLTVSKVFRGEVVTNQKLAVSNSYTTKHISINGRPIFDHYGSIQFAVLCCRDITSDVEFHRTIEQQNELLSGQADMLNLINDRLSVALESVDAGIWELDILTNDQVWSPKVYEIYGIDPAEAVPLDKGISRVHPDDRVDFEYSLNEAIVSHSEFWHKEFRIMHPKRGIVWLKGTGKIIFDKTGTPVKIIGINIDVTEQKQHQQKLLQAEYEKNESLENIITMKDEFLSLVSHEFKTPLTVINSAIQAMELICKDELSDKAKNFMNKIRQNSFRQLRLVNNLLDITRANASKIKINKSNLDIVFITKSIVETVSLYASNKGVKLSFISYVSQKIIGIDEEKYDRILLNLLSNAIKFTPSGKSIIVTLRSKKSSISIEVKDKGIGIPINKQKVIFERFGQVDSSLSRQAEGTGIGLSLVKMLVEALGGSITLKSKEGKGSTFTVLLPAVKVSANESDNKLIEINDNRLIQATSIEFSDIYIEDGPKDKISETHIEQSKVQKLVL